MAKMKMNEDAFVYTYEERKKKQKEEEEEEEEEEDEEEERKNDALLQTNNEQLMQYSTTKKERKDSEEMKTHKDFWSSKDRQNKNEMIYIHRTRQGCCVFDGA